MCQSSQSFHDSQIGMPSEENTGAKLFFFKQEVQYCAKVIQIKYSKFQFLLYQINILFEQRTLFLLNFLHEAKIYGRKCPFDQ